MRACQAGGREESMAMIGDRKTNIFQHFWKSWSHRQKVDFLEKVGLAQRHMASFVTEQW